MLFALYNTLWLLARPALLRKLRRRGENEPLYLHAVHQRFAQYTPEETRQAKQHAGQWLWLHAVSLGETRAAAILLQHIRAQQPNIRILLTHGTATGWAEGQKLLQSDDMQVWLPWDESGAVHRFLQLFQPRAGLVMETEIWPQLLKACQQNHVPIALVNARLSEKTLRQWKRFPLLARKTYARLAIAYAQTPSDAQRLQALGTSNILVTGNLKFDATPDSRLLAQGRILRHQWQEKESVKRPVALLASSRDGEEAMWLEALQSFSTAQRSALQWLIVPRHPQRFDLVASLLQTAGYAVKRRSAHDQHAPPLKHPEIWLGDSMGEMPMYYAMADLALMGGSFAPLGGQNLIEACACGCPVILGPHTFNFSHASEQAIAAGAALRCDNLQQAIEKALTLLQPSASENVSPATMQQAALAFSQAHRGAAAHVVTDLQQRGWLDEHITILNDAARPA